MLGCSSCQQAGLPGLRSSITYDQVKADCIPHPSCSLHGLARSACLITSTPDSTLLLSWRSALQTTAALPFGTIVVILVLWALVTIPLCIFGGIVGKNNR